MKYTQFETDKEFVEYVTRKRPGLKKLFMLYVAQHGISYIELGDLYSKMQTYRALFKGVDLEEYDTPKKMNRKLDQLIAENKANILLKKVLTNRFIHLADHNTHRIIERLIESHGVQYEDLKNTLKQYLHIIRYPQELNQKLENLYENLTGEFNVTYLEKKILKTRAKIVYKDSMVIAVDVQNDFQSLKALGSSNWCIVNKSSFNSYVGSKNKQFVIFDTSYRSSSNMAVLGVTLSAENRILNAHDQSNCSISYTDFILKDKLGTLTPIESPIRFSLRYFLKRKYMYYMKYDYCRTFVKKYNTKKIRKFYLNRIFRAACKYQRINIIIILIEDSKIKPQSRRNKALKYAYNNSNYKVLDILMQDHRVADKLSATDHIKYLDCLRAIKSSM